MSEQNPTEREVDAALYDIAVVVDELPEGPEKEKASEQIKSLAVIITKAQLKLKES